MPHSQHLQRFFFEIEAKEDLLIDSKANFKLLVKRQVLEYFFRAFTVAAHFEDVGSVHEGHGCAFWFDGFELFADGVVEVDHFVTHFPEFPRDDVVVQGVLPKVSVMGGRFEHQTAEVVAAVVVFIVVELDESAFRKIAVL
jgi:hypothetical protein